MKEIKRYIDTYCDEIIRLEKDFDKQYEIILRYLVKANTLLSNTSISSVNDVMYFINKLNVISDKRLETILNIYFSEIFYNRAEVLDKKLVLTDQDFSTDIPDFVDKTKIKTHLFEKDPSFGAKNIILPGGWLDLKNINSFSFDVE